MSICGANLNFDAITDASSELKNSLTSQLGGNFTSASALKSAAESKINTIASSVSGLLPEIPSVPALSLQSELTALAGFDPRGSATIWEKQFQGIEHYAFYRSHPANPQRVKANRYASNKIKKHYIKGKVNPNVDKSLNVMNCFVILQLLIYPKMALEEEF